MADAVNRVSTHVLDTALGRPAAGIAVRLERWDDSSQWMRVGSAQTDDDGRCQQLLPEPHALTAGMYRISFLTGPYFVLNRVSGLYPSVEIAFEVRAGENHYHIPLLLSPNGYTTYRGS
jgi:5-hydroxyisourate hydrolase